MANELIFVSGAADVDRLLAGLEPKLQRKFVRGALRKGAKRITQEYQRIVKAEAYDTGVLAKSAKVVALKRSRKRLGVALVIDRTRLFAKYATKHGGKQPHPAKGESEPFYYPAVIEFGSETQQPVRPLRRALYDNADVYRAYFHADMRQFIAENKVTTTLTKAAGYTGRKFKK